MAIRHFWSVGVHGPDGCFVPNVPERYPVKSITAERDPDGAVTVHLGCDPSPPDGRTAAGPAAAERE